MRPILPGDLDQATRALIPLARQDWPAHAARLVLAPDRADRFRKRTGRAHAAWGDGSLMAAALLIGPRGQAPWCDDTYCAALAAVLTALQLRRQRHHLL
jgi:hypothetical protein